MIYTPFIILILQGDYLGQSPSILAAMYSNGRFINMPNFVDFVDGVTEKKHTHRTVGLNDVSPHTMRRQKMYGHVWIKCAV